MFFNPPPPPAQESPEEQLYKRLHTHITKNRRPDNPKFSPSGYAMEEIRSYLINNPNQCGALKKIIEDHAANKDDKSTEKRILTAFNDLLNPKFRAAMQKKGQLGDAQQAAALIAALDQLREPKQPSKAAVQADDKPYYVMVLGDEGAGKHSIISSFVENRFPLPNEPRIDDERTKLFENMKLTIHVHTSFLRDPIDHMLNGVLIVYDVTDAKSFENMKAWLKETQTLAKGDVCIIIVGNKADSPKRAVDSSDAKEYADQHSIKHIECSAITNKNIETIFTTLCAMMREQRQHRMGPVKVQNSNLKPGH